MTGDGRPDFLVHLDALRQAVHGNRRLHVVGLDVEVGGRGHVAHGIDEVRVPHDAGADAPAIVLYALDNVAAVHKRVDNVQFRPDSWAALLRTWRVPPGRLIDRDRVER